MLYNVTNGIITNNTTANILSHPLNLLAVAGNGYVNLSWKAPAYGNNTVTAYRIYRNGVLIDTVPALWLWYNDANVVNGQNYTYYVTAVNSVGESDKSNEVQATPGGAVPEFSTLVWLVIVALIAMLVAVKRKSS